MALSLVVSEILAFTCNWIFPIAEVLIEEKIFYAVGALGFSISLICLKIVVESKDVDNHKLLKKYEEMKIFTCCYSKTK